MPEPLIYDLSSPGREGVSLPASDVPETKLPTSFLREDLPLPEVSEIDVVRHFVHLSQLNHGVDTGFYPLGSCTMKYNPKINEDLARLPGYAFSHPLQDPEYSQGNLALMFGLQDWLREIGGFAGVSLQPAAGAHGEFTGLMMIRAYHLSRGEPQRTKILVPDSAHGTNPASTSMAGMEVVELPSDDRGNIDLEALRAAACGDRVAGLMLTNPNTLGLFEENVHEVTEIVHDCGGLMYGDGANMNALLGVARPGDMGFDVLHFNLHKTFSTPHGGGGPGSGPVGASERLVEYLPGPIVEVADPGDEETPPLFGFVMPEKSIGRVKCFYGHLGMFVRAYTYMIMHGPEGLRAVSDHAVLNANYLRVKLREAYKVPYDRTCMHEFVAQGAWEDAPGVQALDISKRLMDFGFHPPTNYFPLIVHEALMIEPTETESKETLDAFIAAMVQIAEEAHSDPDVLHQAPHTTPFGRLDEVQAARQLVLCCKPVESAQVGVATQ
jgi:glycine dehydrogenase subunit 2